VNKTKQEILDDHLSLCVLAYARLTIGGHEPTRREVYTDGMMGQAIQAASLFTVASMEALGGPERSARAFELVREMFLELDVDSSVREACLASLGRLEAALSTERDVSENRSAPRGNDADAPGKEGCTG